MEIDTKSPLYRFYMVFVPEYISECKIINYAHSGTYLMESNSKNLNAWKLRIPDGKYKIIGRFEKIVIDGKTLITNKNFILQCLTDFGV